MLRRELGEQLRVVGRGKIGPHQVERGDAAVEAAVADQQDEHAVVRLRADGNVGNRLFEAAFRRAATREQRDVGFGNGVLLLRGVDERRGPLLELLRVLLVARDAGDDEDVGLLCASRRCRQDQPRKHESTKQVSHKTVFVFSCFRGESELHASPFTRRNPHSANTRPTSTRKSAGMSHSSRSSTTVTPRPL